MTLCLLLISPASHPSNAMSPSRSHTSLLYLSALQVLYWIISFLSLDALSFLLARLRCWNFKVNLSLFTSLKLRNNSSKHEHDERSFFPVSAHSPPFSWYFVFVGHIKVSLYLCWMNSLLKCRLYYTAWEAKDQDTETVNVEFFTWVLRKVCVFGLDDLNNR